MKVVLTALMAGMALLAACDDASSDAPPLRAKYGGDSAFDPAAIVESRYHSTSGEISRLLGYDTPSEPYYFSCETVESDYPASLYFEVECQLQNCAECDRDTYTVFSDPVTGELIQFD